MGLGSSIKKGLKRAAKKVTRAGKDLTGVSSLKGTYESLTKLPDAPETEPATPLQDDEALRRARQRATSRRRGGRASTILSNSLGG